MDLIKWSTFFALGLTASTLALVVNEFFGFLPAMLLSVVGSGLSFLYAWKKA